MMSPFLAVHDAQLERITTETGYKVYDDFPGPKVSMPYVVAGACEARDWSDKFKAGQEVISTIHIWSNYPGRKEVAEMQDKCLRALMNGKLRLSPEFNVVFSSLELSEIIIDIDGTTRHGILKLKYLIEEI